MVGPSEESQVRDVSCKDVWDRLQQDPESVLIDVRTKAEWAFVGLPDLSSIDKEVIKAEWQTFPENRIEPAFADELSRLLESAGATKDTELFFICRSGGRSRMAAQAMAALGFTRCCNVAEGFEGPLDPERHRGVAAGWKVVGLPWVQG